MSLLQKYAMLTTFHEISRSFHVKMFFGEKNQQEGLGLMNTISQWWSHIQPHLFPIIEKELDPLTEQQKKLIAAIDLIRIEAFVPNGYWNRGRPSADRVAIARAFLAKQIYGYTTTRELLEHLHACPNLRRICGWELSSQVPSESTFSRAFAEFAAGSLAARAHEALIEQYRADDLVGHLSRDSTDIPAREEPVRKPPAPVREKKKIGRPRKGEVRPPTEPTVVERQLKMTVDEMLSGLGRECTFGVKEKHGGGAYYWIGYKLHVDWADGELPIGWILTSASTHDSQAAIPLGTMSAQRVTSCYALMDSAYDSPAIWEHSRMLGVVPIIDYNHRRREVPEMDSATKRRYCERTTAERGFSLLKEKFGGRDVRVRGYVKVLAHLGFCLLALTADRLLNLLL
jgi:hypothetical protein